MSSTLRHSSRRIVRIAAVSAAAGTLAVGAYALTRSSSPKWPRVELPRDAKGNVIVPTYPKIPSREEQIAALRRNGSSASAATNPDGSSSSSRPVYDLVVIGGGATGTGIALDAATRGLKVALVERGDFASGTSSKSTKLVHGGVRYLEKAFWNLDYAQFELVCEALHERKNFITSAPHLAGSVPILIPLYSWWRAPYFWAGCKAYDVLAGSEGLESSYILSRRKAVEAFPLLRKDGLFGGLVFYDGQQNDSRMNVSIALTAALYGATVANYVEVTRLEKDAAGKVCGVRVRDALAAAGNDGNEFVVHAKGVINATGAFADAVEKMDDAAKADIVCPSSGVHLSLPGSLSPNGMGLLDANTSDGRVIYFLPWQGKMIAGTTDNPCIAEKDPVAEEKDVDFILTELRKYLITDAPVNRDAVLAAWSGIRPLVRDPNSKNTESLVRNHLVSVSESGLLTCAGGKWTTYRQMAEDAVDTAIKTYALQPSRPAAVDISGLGLTSDVASATGSCATNHLRMLGAHGYSSDLPDLLARQFGLDSETATSLASNYGDRAWQVLALENGSNNSTSSSSSASSASPSPSSSSSISSSSTSPAAYAKLSPAFAVLESEVRHAVRSEYAQTAADFLGRRTRMSFLDVDAALEALPRVIDLMAEELHWSRARKSDEWRDTVHYLISMGLPQSLATVSRQDVVDGKYKAALQTASRRAAGAAASKSKPGFAGVEATPVTA